MVCEGDLKVFVGVDQVDFKQLREDEKEDRGIFRQSLDWVLQDHRRYFLKLNRKYGKTGDQDQRCYSKT